jgi:hypothetical protein
MILRPGPKLVEDVSLIQLNRDEHSVCHRVRTNIAVSNILNERGPVTLVKIDSLRARITEKKLKKGIIEARVDLRNWNILSFFKDVQRRGRGRFLAHRSGAAAKDIDARATNASEREHHQEWAVTLSDQLTPRSALPAR